MMYMIEIPGRGPANCVSAIDAAGLADHLRQEHQAFKKVSSLDRLLDLHHADFNALLIFNSLQEAVDAFADPNRWGWDKGNDAREALGRALGNGKITVN